MQTFDPLRPDYINPAHVEMLTPEARASIVTVDPDAPRIAEVAEAPVAEALGGDVPVPMTLDERIASLEQLVREHAAAIAMLQDPGDRLDGEKATGLMSNDEVSHLRHVLAKYFSQDKPA